MKTSTYDTSYPTEPCGGGNPYYRCIYCKRPDPIINGDLLSHDKNCEYRVNKIFQQQMGTAK